MPRKAPWGEPGKFLGDENAQLYENDIDLPER